MTQKWFQKATVQASLVNIIPSAIIGIATILIMIWIANSQINQAGRIAKDQDLRDSIKILRDSILNELKLELAEKEFKLFIKQVSQDSTSSQRQTKLWNDQNLIITNQLRINEQTLQTQVNFNEYQRQLNAGSIGRIDRDNKLKFRIACATVESSLFNLMDSFVYKKGVDETISLIEKITNEMENQLDNPYLYVDTNSVKSWRITITLLKQHGEYFGKHKLLLNETLRGIKLTGLHNFQIEDDIDNISGLLRSLKPTVLEAKIHFDYVYLNKIINIDNEIRDGYFNR